MRQTFVCERLPDGRVGKRLPGWARPVRDDVLDPNPHGRLDMERGLVVSCNAYFAQLGVRLGAPALQETASLFEISLSQPESAQQVRDTLPFAAYGQGQVLATPFKMARVAATLAGGGAMPQGRWIVDETNRRTDAPKPILAPAAGRTPRGHHAPRRRRGHRAEPQGDRAADGGQDRHRGGAGPAVARLVRRVRALRRSAPGGRISFAVLVEHGGYGGAVAAPIAGQIVTAARDLKIIQ